MRRVGKRGNQSCRSRNRSDNNRNRDGRSGSGRECSRGRGGSSAVYLPESVVFAAVFTVLLGISVYMNTGKVDWKLLAVVFVAMAAAGVLILGGIGRSVRKKLEDMEAGESEQEADGALEEEPGKEQEKEAGEALDKELEKEAGEALGKELEKEAGEALGKE